MTEETAIYAVEPTTEARDMQEARRRRDAGMKQATDNAEEHVPGWGDRAFGVFRLYAKQHATFTTEDVRQANAASAEPLEQPPSQRAWGGVAKRAQKDGIVAHDSWTTAKDPGVHCNVVRVWRSLVLSASAAA